MRACIDWPSGEGAVTTDVARFLVNEQVAPNDLALALLTLAEGKTFSDPRGRWSLTPMPPER